MYMEGKNRQTHIPNNHTVQSTSDS